jgi:hypothetical protein
MLTERVYLKNFRKLSFELKNSIHIEIFLFGCVSFKSFKNSINIWKYDSTYWKS